MLRIGTVLSPQHEQHLTGIQILFLAEFNAYNNFPVNLF